MPKCIKEASPLKTFGLLDADRLEGFRDAVMVVSKAHIAGVGFSTEQRKCGYPGAMKRMHDCSQSSILEIVDRVGADMLSTLSRMRDLAVEATWSWLDESDRLFLQCEFNGLTDEISNIAKDYEHSIGFVDVDEMWNGGRHSGAATSGLVRVNVGLWEFTPSHVGIRVEQIGIHSMGSARLAIAMIDSAIEKLEAIRAEYDFLHDQVGSALTALKRHVDSREPVLVSPQKEGIGEPRIRLMAMQKVAVTARNDDLSFQQSIRALVQ